MDESSRPINMLPRLPSDVEPTERTKELVLDLAEHLYPGINAIGELGWQDRGRWIPLASTLLREPPEISSDLETLTELFERGVNAEIDSTVQLVEVKSDEIKRRSEEDERERGRREWREEELHQEDLAARRQQRIQQEEKWRIDRERIRKRDTNGHIVERMLIGMAALSFLLAVGLLAVGAVVGQTSGAALSISRPGGLTFAVGGAGATGLLSLSLLALHRLRRERDERETPTSSPIPAEEMASG